MKKLLIALVAAYIGCLGYLYYQKVQTNKIWKDERLQYFAKVTKSSSFERISSPILRWDNGIRIKVKGDSTIEDFKNLQALISQLNELTAPQKIILSNYNPNVFITFQNVNLNKDWGHSGIFSRYLIKTSKKYFHPPFEAYSYYNTLFEANIKIRTDGTTPDQRKTHLLKCIASILLDIDRNYQDHYNDFVEFNKVGNNITIPTSEKQFWNSIFNSNCIECSELSEIDKFIIKTFYSKEIEKTIEKRSLVGYITYYKPFFYGLGILQFLILICLYFTGFFQKYFFSFIDQRIKTNWIALNYKVFSIFFCTFVVFSLSHIATNFLTFYGIPGSTIIRYQLITKSLLQILSYCLIPVNIVYLIEKILFPKLEQFAKQQIFSFIFLIVGIVGITYLLGILHITHEPENYWLVLFLSIGLGVIRFLYNYSNYQKKLAVMDKEQELNRLRELKTRAELNVLQSKINPHFLYNALNSIAGLAHQDADKVERMALSLSQLFRYNINKDDSDFTTVQSEIEMVQLYLDIEKARFGDKLKYMISIAEDVENEQIPKFIVQPLVENAIKHGLANLTSQGLLSIEVTKTDNSLCIKVSDNGPDFPEDMMTGYGLQNIYEKLDILYPKRYEVLLQNGENKNITVILKD